MKMICKNQNKYITVTKMNSIKIYMTIIRIMSKYHSKVKGIKNQRQFQSKKKNMGKLVINRLC